MKIKIYSVYHKKFHVPFNDMVQPIQVGTEEFFGDPFLRDNSGKNISHLNKTYCELTAMYWIRHNDVTSDYIGLAHYRRWFDLKTKGKEKSTNYHAIIDYNSFTKEFLNEIGLENNYLQSYLKDVDIVLPEAWDINEDQVLNVYQQYKSVGCCRISDLDEALLITLSLYPEYGSAIETLKTSRYMFTANMFIMRSNIFREYMDWLMPIMDTLSENIDFTKIDPQFKRAPGFIAERLFTLWLIKNISKFKVKYAPLIFIKHPNVVTDKRPIMDLINNMQQKIRRYRKISAYKMLLLLNLKSEP